MLGCGELATDSAACEVGPTVGLNGEPEESFEPHAKEETMIAVIDAIPMLRPR